MFTYPRFIWIGHIEGVSYLILLFIAMPLKYLAHQLQPVRITGMIHGMLFVLFIVALIAVAAERQWSLKKIFLAFLLSLIPFGTFYLRRVTQ